MADLDALVTRIAHEQAFSGTVRVDVSGTTSEWAFGLADRRHGVANTPHTRYGIASGTKGFTALTVMSLIESGELSLDVPIRAVLGDDLPEIDASVTVEHLLGHRSGIGDYLDESEGGDINEYAMPLSVYEMSGTEHYLPALDGHPQVAAPGDRFAYNNSGFVVLALIAERAATMPFERLVAERVCEPAGMTDTGFLRSDELPGDIALGYLEPDGLRNNVFHLPVMGSGDGGIISSGADIHRLWAAMYAGRIVNSDAVVTMTTPRSKAPVQRLRYGLGFWLAAHGSAVMLEGYDAGVSFRTVHDPTRSITHTVLSNTSDGAWPVTRALDQALATE